MYRYSNGQIRLADFKQPVGMNLKEDNRWVKKAQIIPWNEIEKRYAALFTNRKGNVAKPLRLALGARIIQAEYGYSDEETVLQIQENPYLQYFCGYPGYDDEHLPFDPSLMVYFRKRLTPEIIGEINEIVIRCAKEAEEKKDDNNNDDDSDDTDIDISDDSDDDDTDPAESISTKIMVTPTFLYGGANTNKPISRKQQWKYSAPQKKQKKGKKRRK